MTSDIELMLDGVMSDQEKAVCKRHRWLAPLLGGLTAQEAARLACALMTQEDKRKWGLLAPEGHFGTWTAPPIHNLQSRLIQLLTRAVSSPTDLA